MRKWTSKFCMSRNFKRMVTRVFNVVVLAARLRGAHDGLFTGQIDAVNLNNASYRVTFDRWATERQSCFSSK